MIKSKNPVYWLLKIKNPTHQIDENLGLNPGWVFWFSSLYTYIYFCSKIPENPCLALALFTPLFWDRVKPEAIFDVMCGYGDCCT